MEIFNSFDEAQQYCDKYSQDWNRECPGDCCWSYCHLYIEGNRVMQEHCVIYQEEESNSTSVIGEIDISSLVPNNDRGRVVVL